MEQRLLEEHPRRGQRHEDQVDGVLTVAGLPDDLERIVSEIVGSGPGLAPPD